MSTRLIKMARTIEYYTGYEITEDVIDKMNLIILKRFRESRYSPFYEGYNDLKEICRVNHSKPEETNIILGIDWYILYTENEISIEISEWVDIETVPNKLEQTMEMFSVLKKFLLSIEDKNIFATMKHNTSYKFYSSLIQRGLLQEKWSDVSVDAELPKDVEVTRKKILEQYGFVEDFLKDENRDKEQEEALEDYIYHDIAFDITDKFKKRYKK